MSGEHLLDQALADDLAARWQQVQAGFVDDPQESVRAADGLVEEAMAGIARGLHEVSSGLRAQWESGNQGETEQLRRTLQQYRDVLERLLNG